MRRVIELLCAGLFLLLISCEEEINRPVFRTLTVTELTPEGVTFNAKLQAKGDQQITDHGFVWSTHSEPKISDSAFYFNGSPELGTYSYRVTDGLETGRAYYVRSFVKADGQTYYGNDIKFIGLGSATPEILEVIPMHGGSGDTITIEGDHFGKFIESTSVEIGPVTCELIAVSTDKILFRLPYAYETGSYPITLKVADKTITTPNDFVLDGPVIQSMSPIEGDGGTEVTLSGTGFSPIAADNYLYFDETRISITSATSTEIKFTVPALSVPGPKAMSLTLNNATTYPASPFTLLGPVITSISPTSGVTGTQITITGSGFSTNPFYNTVLIDPLTYLYGTVISATPTQLVVEVGELYYNTSQSRIQTTMSVEVNNIRTYSPTQFTIKGPSITGFSPASQYEGREMTIYGEDFSSEGQNRVFFNDVYEAEILSSSPTALTVKVPFPQSWTGGVALPANCKISVAVRRYTYNHPTRYTVLNPWTRLADFPDARYGVTSFTIGSYAYMCMGISAAGGDRNDLWRFDPTVKTWKKMADCPGHSRAFAFSFVINGKAYVGGGGDYANSSYDLIANLFDLWEYDPATDSWTQMQSFSSSGIAGKRPDATSIGQYGYFGIASKLYTYDQALNQWTVSASPIVFADGGVAETVGNKGYFGMGINNNEMWEFDPAGNTWTQLEYSPLYHPGWDYLTSFVINNKVYVSNTSMLYEFDPSQNVWIRKSNIPFVMSYRGSFSINNTGYIGTGLDGHGLANFYSFDPTY